MKKGLVRDSEKQSLAELSYIYLSYLGFVFPRTKFWLLFYLNYLFISCIIWSIFFSNFFSVHVFSIHVYVSRN